MTYEEYLAKYDELEEAMALLKKQFIDSNKEFDEGTKVKVTDKDGNVQYGYVLYNRMAGYDVKPHLVQYKKDGTPSVHKPLWYNYSDTLEKVEED